MEAVVPEALVVAGRIEVRALVGVREDRAGVKAVEVPVVPVAAADAVIATAVAVAASVVAAMKAAEARRTG